MAWIHLLVTLSFITFASVRSADNVTIAEFCACWRVLSSSIQAQDYAVTLSFEECWQDATSTMSPNQTYLTYSSDVKFDISVVNHASVSKQVNCSLQTACRTRLRIATLEHSKRYTVMVRPVCSSCSDCSGKLKDFLIPTPVTTPKPFQSSVRRHKYMMPITIVAGIVGIICAILLVIRRAYERSKQGKARSESWTNMEEVRDSEPQHQSETEKVGVVNKGFQSYA